MHIINLTPIEVGVYNDHKADHITMPPQGWAMIPDDMEKPSTFPRLGSITAEEITHTYEVENENGEIKQHERIIMTVTSMTEGTLPDIPEVEPEPSTEEILNALLGVE